MPKKTKGEGEKHPRLEWKVFNLILIESFLLDNKVCYCEIIIFDLFPTDIRVRAKEKRVV